MGEGRHQSVINTGSPSDTKLDNDSAALTLIFQLFQKCLNSAARASYLCPLSAEKGSY